MAWVVSRLEFEVRVAKSPELGARGIERATHAFSSGDRAGAEREYLAAARQGLKHPASWSNLAALGIALGDAGGAIGHARRALELDARSVDAWVNLGVASWRANQRRDAAQATSQALALVPGLEAAALNYGRMLQAVSEHARAAEVVGHALRHNPASWRLALADAQIARLLMQHDRVRRSAVLGLGLQAKHVDPTLPGSSGLRPAAGKDVRSALQAACDHLDALAVPYHLMAGTLLAIVKDGQLFPHDKDVDLALPDLDDAGVSRVRDHFGSDDRFGMYPPAPQDSGRTSVIGVIHRATGVGIDLILPMRLADGAMRNEMGWPDQLGSVLRPYDIGTLHWDGRDWPVPVPTGQYLEDLYGSDWREQVRTEAGIAYDRCYGDTMVCNPSRTPESMPRAINLGLIRLMLALQAREWSKAVAYCAQLLHREDLPEVRAILRRLQAAGHDGLRFDG